MSVRRQRGVAALLAAVCIGMVMAALVVIDIGNLYFARREIQRAADLSALAGAQTVSNGGGCKSATTSARNNAVTGNGLSNSIKLMVVCGRWDPTVNVGQSYFVTTGEPINAVRVTVSEAVPYFFVGPEHVIRAVSTAETTNIRSFSLTSAVASLSGGLLNGLVNGLLGTRLNLSLASYEGLATTQIKLGDLATALGVGSMSQLLRTQVPLSQLVMAMIAAAGHSTTSGVTAITDLGTIEAAMPNGLNVALGNSGPTNGLLVVPLDDPQAAVNATVNVLDMLLVAAEVAHGQSAIDFGPALNLNPVANVMAQVKLIKPPVIAVGEDGQNVDGTWRTSAHSAEVQVYLNVNLLNLSLGSTYPGLSNLVSGAALNLPIYIKAGEGPAYLASTVCTTQQATSQSLIVATTGVANLCIGADASDNFTNTSTATQCTKPAQIATVSALGRSRITVSIGNSSSASGLNLGLQAASTSLIFNGMPNGSDTYQSTDTNGVGAATSSLLTQLSTAMSSSIYASVAGVDVSKLMAPLLSAVVGLLSSILISLDALLVPLLQLLGVQIGVSTVHDLGLTCGQAQLVGSL